MDYPKLLSVEYLRLFTLRLSFSDGFTAEVDFQDQLTGGVFDALNDESFFRSFILQPQFGSIEWSNGADFSPEFLYDLAKTSGADKTDRQNRAHCSLKSA